MKLPTHAAIAFFVGIAVIVVQIAIGYFAFYWLPDWQTRGQFGDVFGAANALFSGLAFTGLIYTVFLQREDLVLQRTELELTRQELRRSAEAQEQSEIALRAQSNAASMSAKMSTASALLEHYRSELQQLRRVVMPGNDPRRVVIRDYEARERTLLEILDAMYNQVSEHGDENE